MSIRPPAYDKNVKRAQRVRRNIKRAKAKRRGVRERLKTATGLKRKRLRAYHALLSRTIKARRKQLRSILWGVDGISGPAPGHTWKDVASKGGDGLIIPWWNKDAMRNIVTTANLDNQLKAEHAKHYGVPIRDVVSQRTSWFRSTPHNASIGGASRSYHTERGKKPAAAIDGVYWIKRGAKRIAVPTKITAMLAARVPAYRNGGIGTYPSFVHRDHRSYKSRW